MMEKNAYEKNMHGKNLITAGLEIHQQLDTHKLFCECPSILRNDEPLFRIRRKLNPVAGESGKIDIAAAYEKEKNKIFVYEVYDTNCLVELDEEPPHEINPEALKIALQIALLLNCRIFPVSQVMRKTVIDGSDTSGFQRTVLIAHDGWIETSEGKVGIETIALEEDAARPASKQEIDKPGFEDSKIYKLDRLGIPLVEITTKPDLKSPEQIREAALKIGEILRACKVRRGIGTIRQDLNISIPGSKRVEIKGFQEQRVMVKIIENEIRRQEECIREKSCKSEVRRAKDDGTTEFLRPMPSAERMYPETDLELLKISKERINEAKKFLPKIASEHKKYLQEFGLNDELISLVLKQNKIEDFKYLSNITKNYNLIAKALTIYPKLDIEIIESILQNVEDNKISENDVKLIMGRVASGESLEEAMKKEKIDVREEVKKLLDEKPNLSANAYMGLMMAKFKGRISGKEVMDEIKKASA